MCLANVRYETSENAWPRSPFPQKTNPSGRVTAEAFAEMGGGAARSVPAPSEAPY